MTGQASRREAVEGTRSLREVLFAPRSIALIGQSNDAGKTAGRPLKFLRQAGYAGRVYPVNARRDEVLGERAWPSLEALPEVPEHAYIVAPTEAAIEAIEACGRAGVAVATVLSDGFAEAGDIGVARENRLTEIVRTTGMRIVGPSSLGIVDLRNGALITANAAFDEPGLPVGKIFGASHSGGMIGTFLSRGRACGIGFAGLVSVGNEVDLSLGEICLATLDDPDIDGYLLFLETLRHADTLRRFAECAAAAGKPVLAYKLGRSAAARELALTHTGALAGEDDVADAFLRDCGIARVESLSGLLEGLPLLKRVPPRRGPGTPRVAVITTTAGGAATVIDPLASRGIEVGPPSEDTYARFEAAGIKVARARLIDLTLVGTRYEVMKAALDILATAPEFDLVVTVVGSSARFYPHLAVRPIVDSAAAPKPIAAFLVPEAPQARAELAKAGVANFYTPEACADAVAAALSRRLPRAVARPQHEVAADARSPRAGAGRSLDELEAYGLFDRVGVPRAPSIALDIDAEVPPLPFAYPVAAKVLSAEITHKSDVGGVALGLVDAAALAAAMAATRARLPQARRVLVQPMIAGLGEVLIGYRVDPDAGPMIMLAAGGIYTEIYRDRSLRLAPVDLATAGEMIAEVRGLKALAGYRGKPAGDLDAVAHAVVALSRLADDPTVREAEINPLLVRADGVVAIDAVVRLA
jgi:acetate---CoA ligase (ADP-forming)